MKKKILSILLIVMLILSIVYTFLSYKDISEYSTVGASFFVNLIEFSVYKSGQILLSSSLYLLVITFTLFYLNKTREYKITNIIYIMLICINIFLANKFFVIYLILTIISLLIVISANYISALLWGDILVYNDGDLIETSKHFTMYEDAKNMMDIFIESSGLPLESVYCDVLEDRDGYFFEIYSEVNVLLLKDERFQYVKK